MNLVLITNQDLEALISFFKRELQKQEISEYTSKSIFEKEVEFIDKSLETWLSKLGAKAFLRLDVYPPEIKKPYDVAMHIGYCLHEDDDLFLSQILPEDIGDYPYGEFPEIDEVVRGNKAFLKELQKFEPKPYQTFKRGNHTYPIPQYPPIQLKVLDIPEQTLSILLSAKTFYENFFAEEENFEFYFDFQ